jgi:hypothetical protein
LSVLVADSYLPAGVVRAIPGYGWAMNATVLWVIAVVLAIVGIVQLLQGQIIFGIILLIAAAAVGPGGWSVFRSRA